MSKFARETHTINGVKTVVHTAGSGEPVVFFHGAGTIDGFDFAEPWAERFRVIVPYHPGFGESGDDPTFTDLHDYVMHYLELFDALRLDRFNLVGLSLGGYLAAKFASEHGHRVKKLALIAPAGMIDPHEPDARPPGGAGRAGSGAAGLQLRRAQAAPAGEAGPGLHGRPVSRGDDGGAAAFGSGRATRSSCATCIASRCRR